MLKWICIGLLLLFILSCQKAQKNVSTRPPPIPETQPLPQGVTVYGLNGDGCLQDGREFVFQKSKNVKPAFSKGYYFGHASLVQLLENFEKEYSLKFADAKKYPILLSDLAKKGGGVLLPHKSHQSGLDVDIIFFNFKNKPLDLIATNQGVLEDFDFQRNWWALGYFALDKNVGRIFVAPEVKLMYCQRQHEVQTWQGKQTEILKRLRPWFGHRDHFHVSLECPRGEAYCYNGASTLPEGDDCAVVQSWIDDPKHVSRNARALADYKPGVYSARCFDPTPNEMGNPYHGEEK